jgi:hypothetical protein
MNLGLLAEEYLQSFLTVGTRWRCVVNVTARLIHSQGIISAPEAVWTLWEMKIFLPPQGLEPSFFSSVTILTDISDESDIQL